MKRRMTKFQFGFDEANILESRALMAVIGFTTQGQISVAASPGPISFIELDGADSKIAIRVDQTRQLANAVKVRAGETFTLTFPDASQQYTIFSNKPDHVQIVESATKASITALKPGFLGMRIASADGTQVRYLGLYIGDNQTGIIPDVNEGFVPLGSVTSVDATGNAFLESMNFQQATAPIDYLYIYDQGGANYRDGNLKGLLNQAATYGLVPSVVYYNIQNVNGASGESTGVVEGPAAAFQSINNYNLGSQSLYTDYMKAYFTKLEETLNTIQASGVPVQLVMEPDFLGYMSSQAPATYGLPSSFMPNASDRTQNTARVDQIYDSGLLDKTVDPIFPNSVQGFVQAVNYAVGKLAPNVRIGWKTNLWAVADQQNWSLGIMHITDSVRYPWQSQWSGPEPKWEDGRAFIARQAAGVATFLKNAGTQYWTGDTSKKPFLSIDKYGVDGAYLFDPNFLSSQSSTAAFGNLMTFVSGAYVNLANIQDSDTQKYFGLSKSAFADFYTKYNGAYNKAASDVISVFTNLRNAAIADYNLAQWFWNADQWNNYLYFVNQLSNGLGGTKVMLWQIPQGHINGSTSGGDLTNTDANYEDSATSYFFGDTFTPAAGGIAHFKMNLAKDPKITNSGDQITWDEHMSLAQSSNVMSVLFGAGLGISTRGTPTPAGGINDQNFWKNKAAGYLKTKFQLPAVAAGGASPVTADSATWPLLSISPDTQQVRLMSIDNQSTTTIRPFRTRIRGLQAHLIDLNSDAVPELVLSGTANGVRKVRAFDVNSLKTIRQLANINLPHLSTNFVPKVEEAIESNPGREIVLQQNRPSGKTLQWIYSQSGRLIRIRRS